MFDLSVEVNLTLNKKINKEFEQISFSYYEINKRNEESIVDSMKRNLKNVSHISN